jgi:hypothetical protein
METTVLIKPDRNRLQLIMLKGALQMELIGMKRKGKSAYSIAKSLGYKGTKQEVLDQIKLEINR